MGTFSLHLSSYLFTHHTVERAYAIHFIPKVEPLGRVRVITRMREETQNDAAKRDEESSKVEAV